MSRYTVVKELFGYLWKQKKFWLIPIIFVVVILGILIILGESSAIAPFIYSLF